MSGPSKQLQTSDETPEEAHHRSRLIEHWSDVRYFLLGLLRNADMADELVQCTMQTALEKGAAIADDKLRSWLLSVAHNQAMLHLRRRRVDLKARQKIGEASLVGGVDLQTSGSELYLSIVKQEDIDRVRLALSELDPVYRTLVELRIYEDLTFEQIAQQQKLPLGTALTRMRRALQLLREKLKS